MVAGLLPTAPGGSFFILASAATVDVLREDLPTPLPEALSPRPSRAARPPRSVVADRASHTGVGVPQAAAGAISTGACSRARKGRAAPPEPSPAQPGAWRSLQRRCQRKFPFYLDDDVMNVQRKRPQTVTGERSQRCIAPSTQQEDLPPHACIGIGERILSARRSSANQSKSCRNRRA
jgi:hypothetical protein